MKNKRIQWICFGSLLAIGSSAPSVFARDIEGSSSRVLPLEGLLSSPGLDGEDIAENEALVTFYTRQILNHLREDAAAIETIQGYMGNPEWENRYARDAYGEGYSIENYELLQQLTNFIYEKAQQSHLPQPDGIRTFDKHFYMGQAAEEVALALYGALDQNAQQALADVQAYLLEPSAP